MDSFLEYNNSYGYTFKNIIEMNRNIYYNVKQKENAYAKAGGICYLVLVFKHAGFPKLQFKWLNLMKG